MDTWDGLRRHPLLCGRISGGAPTRIEIGFPSGGGVIGEGNTLFLHHVNEGYVAAMNASSFATQWTASSDYAIASTAGGGVAIQSGDALNVLDSSGNVVSSTFATAGGVPQENGGRLVATAAGVRSEVGEAIAYAATEWVTPNGSFLAAKAPPECTPPVHPVRFGSQWVTRRELLL